MQILKTFVDSQGTRHKIGAAVPENWDKATLEHYMHHGMVGTADDLKPKSRGNATSRRKVAPTDKTPNAPAGTSASDALQEHQDDQDEQTPSGETSPEGHPQVADAGSADINTDANTNPDGKSSDA